MTLRPCITCGEPSPGTYCPGCRPTDTRSRNRKGNAAHDPRWRSLSTSARRAQPWCTDCGSSSDLTADHLIPQSVAPELIHSIENIAVRCRSCNSRRGHTGWTTTDGQTVLTALTATYRRRPTRGGRERIAAAERALSDLGICPQRPAAQSVGKARGAMKGTLSA